MLRITTQKSDTAIEIKLEGRVAGPWVAEISRAWMETAPQLGSRKLSLDLRNVTYADAGGKKVLSDIHAETGAELMVSTPWTQYLADEIRATKSSNEGEDAE